MDLENKLATNITRFLLEWVKGLRMSVDRWNLTRQVASLTSPDMIFYHTRLKCYVVVELKIVDFMPEFIGKLNFYVSAADELLRGEEITRASAFFFARTKIRPLWNGLCVA